MKFIIIIEEADGKRFWVSGRKWSGEFPDAGIFHNTQDAIKTAKQFGQQAKVVGDYGLESEQDIYVDGREYRILAGDWK